MPSLVRVTLVVESLHSSRTMLLAVSFLAQHATHRSDHEATERLSRVNSLTDTIPEEEGGRVISVESTVTGLARAEHVSCGSFAWHHHLRNREENMENISPCFYSVQDLVNGMTSFTCRVDPPAPAISLSL